MGRRGHGAPHRHRGLGALIHAAILALLAAPVFAFQKPEFELELDPYYSDYAMTVAFSSPAAGGQGEQGEMKTYRAMLDHALVPRFMVLEASVNPLPIAGVVVRNAVNEVYRRAGVTPSLNLVDAVTAGFEEPYALSLFLGKVIDFDPGRKTLKRRKRGYVGYLLSGGNFHIMESLMVPDNWVEAEAKVKGDLVTDARKMSWSLRIGQKSHSSREIADSYYFGIRRDRIDYENTPLSFLLSAGFDYRVDFSKTDFRPLSHFVLVEKNLPVKSAKKAFTVSLGLGFQWLSREKYGGALGLRRARPESRIMIRPNLKF